MQRCLDFALSLVAIAFLLPLLVPIILLLRFTGEGEILYFQQRIGKGGKVFNLYKFATMKKNSPSIGSGPITIRNDPRVLPLGKFLRRSKINELPQLLNILFGQMSVVGPRPMTLTTFGAYDVDVQNIIKKVRPGLSGIGSIVFRDEENLIPEGLEAMNFYKSEIAPYKGALEVWYVNNSSIMNYFKIIYFTCLVVLRSDSESFWHFFPLIPSPPLSIANQLNYPKGQAFKSL